MHAGNVESRQKFCVAIPSAHSAQGLSTARPRSYSVAHRCHSAPCPSSVPHPSKWLLTWKLPNRDIRNAELAVAPEAIGGVFLAAIHWGFRSTSRVFGKGLGFLSGEQAPGGSTWTCRRCCGRAASDGVRKREPRVGLAAMRCLGGGILAGSWGWGWLVSRGQRLPRWLAERRHRTRVYPCRPLICGRVRPSRAGCVCSVRAVGSGERRPSGLSPPFTHAQCMNMAMARGSRKRSCWTRLRETGDVQFREPRLISH